MIKKQLRTLNQDQARLRMASLCSRSEQCEYDILDKLTRHGVSRADAEKIVDFLYENRFLDEERFVRAFVRDKVRFNGWGERKIRYALAMKKIPSPLVARIMEEVGEETFLEAAKKIIRTKSNNLDLEDYGDRTKLFRHLAGRGFNTSTITAALSQFRKDSSDGTGE